MSVRAYILEEIKTGDEIFNLWHDRCFVDLIDTIGKFDALNTDGCGIMSFFKEDLDEIEEMIAKDNLEAIYSKEEIERAKEIVRDIREEMRKRKTDYIDFYCF